MVWTKGHFIDKFSTKMLLLVHNLPIHEIYDHFLTKEGDLIEDLTTNYPFLGSYYPWYGRCLEVLVNVVLERG